MFGSAAKGGLKQTLWSAYRILKFFQVALGVQWVRSSQPRVHRILYDRLTRQLDDMLSSDGIKPDVSKGIIYYCWGPLPRFGYVGQTIAPFQIRYAQHVARCRFEFWKHGGRHCQIPFYHLLRGPGVENSVWIPMRQCDTASAHQLGMQEAQVISQWHPRGNTPFAWEYLPRNVAQKHRVASVRVKPSREVGKTFSHISIPPPTLLVA